MALNLYGGRWSLSELRKTHDWTRLSERYYANLSIEDFDLTRLSFQGLKSLNEIAAKRLASHTLTYVDAIGKILRLNRNCWNNHSEAYFLYEGNQLQRIVQFGIITHPLLKLLCPGELISEQHLHYDQRGRLIDITIQDYRTRLFPHAGGAKRHIGFVYDEEGLLRSTAWSDDSYINGKQIPGKVVTRYDREEQRRKVRLQIDHRAVANM